MAILVTGGAGFIGSNLVDELLRSGNQVVVVDNFDPFYDTAIKEQNILQAQDFNEYFLYRTDISDSEGLSEVFNKHDIEVVVHLAAKAGVRPSIQDPKGYYKTNVEGTVNILEECRSHNIQKIVFASSSSVYGNNKKVPFAEADNVDYPISPYAATKKAGELLCYNYHHLYDMNIFCMRFFTVYGRRGRPEMAIAKFTNMIDNGQTVPVYGFGEPKRDFTYIDDILQGVINSIERVNGYEIFNIGESNTIRVDGLIELIEKAVGKKAKTENLPMQPGDVIETYADITKAKKLLEYNPTTPIGKGIEKYVEWYQKNK